MEKYSVAEVNFVELDLPESEWIRKITADEYAEIMACYNKKQAKKDAIINNLRAVWRVIAFVLFMPFVISFKVLAMFLRYGGAVLSLGLPYGLYCLYQTVVQLRSGTALADISQITSACVFAIAPFAVFALSVLLEKLADVMENQTL